jgi:hypothetical protein
MLTWALGQHPNLLPLDESGWLAKFALDLRATYTVGKQGVQLARLGIREPDFYEIFAKAINGTILSQSRYGSEFARDVDERSPLLRYRSPADPKTRWVDASPDYSFRVHDLFELFPQARFIHIVRDVKEVAASLMQLDKAASSLRSIEFAYREWRRFTRACLEAERAFGSNMVLRLRYPDLVSDSERELRRCLAFIDESFSPDCLEPVQHILASSRQVSARVPAEFPESAIIADATELSDEVLAEPEPRYEPDVELQSELAAELVAGRADHPLPMSGPVSQRGRAIGLCHDSWVDGALIASVLPKEQIQKVTIEGSLPALPGEEEATLFLSLDEDSFRETFALGDQISWTVSCSVAPSRPAALRLRSTRTVCQSREGLGEDERDLVLFLKRITFAG